MQLHSLCAGAPFSHRPHRQAATPCRPRCRSLHLTRASTGQATSTCVADDPVVETWLWSAGQGKRRRIAYTVTGSGPVPVVLVHGMGACHEHFAKLLAELDGNRYTAYGLDLLGFGASDKPLPEAEHTYSYETWSCQVADFVQQVVGQSAVLVGNSAGALTALKVAVEAPQLARGLMLLDCSLRSMHERNQPPALHPFIAAFQWVLRHTPVGQWLVQSILRTPGQLRSILASAYGDPSNLSPELVASCTRHLQDSTSAAVLLDVFTNSTGVLPQDLLPLNTIPTVVLWGAADPWEPVERAREVFEGFVTDFVELPGCGHFPQDEVPSLVAAMLDAFVDECNIEVLDQAEERSARCGPGASLVTLRGLMAAAEVDPRI